LAVILFTGLALRLAYVTRPFDHRIRTTWRQSDYIQIARNFDREGMNILYPRIDWRRNTPGYVEAEFPLVPWLGAALYRTCGYHEWYLRAVSCLFAVAALLLFAWLASRLLPPAGALFAVAAYAVNPLLIYLSTAIQPEPLMMFLSLAAFVLILRWEQQPDFTNLLAASLAVSASILAKTPAAPLGLLLAWVVLKKKGFQAFSDWRVYAAGLIGILPPLLWYRWAKHFWTVYGNSLGISNETHFLGLDVLLPPWFLLGNLKWETLAVFSPAGWFLLLAALFFAHGRLNYAGLWYALVWVCYMVAARTSGDDWAYYYHCSSVAPACLLMGSGVGALLAPHRPLPLWLQAWRRPAAALLSGAALLGLMGVMGLLIRLRDTNTDLLAMRQCAQEFAAVVPADGKIVVKGGRMFDELGHPVAWNEPMVFAWMDRKGFNYGLEELSLETIERIAKEGGRYWMVLRSDLEKAGIEAEAERRFRRVADCDGYTLYDLSGQ
jgi:hypothetical protein